jgi:hypothetical protein
MTARDSEVIVSHSPLSWRVPDTLVLWCWRSIPPNPVFNFTISPRRVLRCGRPRVGACVSHVGISIPSILCR